VKTPSRELLGEKVFRAEKVFFELLQAVLLRERR